MTTKNPFLKHLNKPVFIYFIESLVLFLFLYSIYNPIILDFDIYNKLLLASYILIGLTIYQYFSGPDLLSRCNIPHGLTGLSWALTSPLLFSYYYSKPFYFYEFYSDFLFGLTIFIVLFLGQYLLTKHLKHLKLFAGIFTILDILLLIFPFSQIAYYVHVKHCVSPQTLMAIYMSTPTESYKYIHNSIGNFGTGITILILIITLYIFYKLNKRIFQNVEEYTQSNTKHIFQTFTFVILFIYSFFYLFPQTSFIKNYNNLPSCVKKVYFNQQL